MDKLLKRLLLFKYFLLSRSKDGGISTVILARQLHPNDLFPPGLVVQAAKGKPYCDVKVFYAARKMDSALIPAVVEQFGLTMSVDGGQCMFSYRLFEGGYDALYLEHVLNNLGACLRTVIDEDEREDT